MSTKSIYTISVILFLVSFIISCSPSKLKIQNNLDSKIDGIWAEHWEKDSLNPNDVNYVDTVKITYSQSGKLIIQCTNRDNYRYAKVKLSNNRLKFRMQNLDVNSKNKFYIHYNLEVKMPDSLIGEVDLINNAKWKVYFKKVK